MGTKAKVKVRVKVEGMVGVLVYVLAWVEVRLTLCQNFINTP